jgi:hypothetical protein
MRTSSRLAAFGLGVLVIVAACGGVASPTPVETAAPTASPTAAPTIALSAAPTAAPTSAATPAPTEAQPSYAPADPAAAAAVVAAFKLLIADPALSYHMEQTGSASAAGQSMDYSYGVDISGQDFAAVINAGGTETRLTAIGTKAYLKSGDAAWESMDLDRATVTDILNPWQYLGSLDALVPDFMAPEPAGAFVFRNGAPVDYQTTSMREADIVGKITTLAFLVMPDGTPVAFGFDATSPDGQGGTMETTSTVRFTKVGETITITSPIP